MAEPENSNLDASSSVPNGLYSACDHLRTAEKLLLNPNPRAVEHAGFVLQQALSLTQTCVDTAVAAEQLADFRAACIRVKILLEGALRAQWVYIHRMTAATSTYTAGPGTRRWSPRACTLNLEA